MSRFTTTKQNEMRFWNDLEQIERKVRIAETKATEALGLHKTGIVATPNDPETIKKIKGLKLQADSAREKLLNCVSSHRIETSSEAIGLVMACQRDVWMGSNSRCQK